MGRPKAPPWRDGPESNVAHTEAHASEKRTPAEENAELLATNNSTEDAQQWQCPDNSEKARETTPTWKSTGGGTLYPTPSNGADASITASDQSILEPAETALLHDFSFINTSPTAVLSPSQWLDPISSSVNAIPVESDMDHGLEPLCNTFDDAGSIPDLDSERVGGDMLIPTTHNKNVMHSSCCMEDEQIQALSSLSLALFQCKRSVATFTASKNPRDALRCFSLSPTTGNAAQIDYVFVHTRTLNHTLGGLWHKSTAGPDQATALLGLSCYLRLLQVYDSLLGNLHHSLETPSTLPMASELLVGCFAPSSTQSIQLVLYLVSLLVTDLQQSVRRILATMTNYNPSNHWDPTAQRRTEKLDGLENTVNGITYLEKNVQEKIKMLHANLASLRDTNHVPTNNLGTGFPRG